LIISESYVLLDTLGTLQAYASPIIEQISLMLGELKPSASNSLLRCIDVIIQACNSANCFNAIGQVIYNGSLIDKLLRVIIEGTELNQVIVGYLMVTYRLLIYDVNQFTTVILYSQAKYFGRFLDVILEKYDCLSQGKQRKLTGLAIAQLIGTGDETILLKIEGLFVVLTSIAIELKNLDAKE
jgi:hypothetical protein